MRHIDSILEYKKTTHKWRKENMNRERDAIPSHVLYNRWLNIRLKKKIGCNHGGTYIRPRMDRCLCAHGVRMCVCVSVRSRPFRCVRAYVSKQYMRLFVVSPNSSGGTCRMKRCLLFVVRSFALYACVCVCVCVFTHKQSSTLYIVYIVGLAYVCTYWHLFMPWMRSICACPCMGICENGTTGIRVPIDSRPPSFFNPYDSVPLMWSIIHSENT